MFYHSYDYARSRLCLSSTVALLVQANKVVNRSDSSLCCSNIGSIPGQLIFFQQCENGTLVGCG